MPLGELGGALHNVITREYLAWVEVVGVSDAHAGLPAQLWKASLGLPTCRADLLLRQSHFQVRRRSRQPVMQPWDQCTPFQPPFTTSTPMPRLAEVAAVILLHDVPKEDPACGQGQDAQSCDSYFPTVEELVLRPNKFYRHAPREFLEAWGLPPGSPGFVRSAVLDSMDLHGAWGLDRGGPEQRTFWVPGDPQLPPRPPWAGPDHDDCAADGGASCGAAPSTEGSDGVGECSTESDVGEDDGSDWYEPPLEEPIGDPQQPPSAGAAAAVGGTQRASQPPSSQPSRSLVELAPRCAPQRIKALLAAKAATKEAAAWDSDQKVDYVLWQLVQMEFGEAVEMDLCWLRSKMMPGYQAVLGKSLGERPMKCLMLGA